MAVRDRVDAGRQVRRRLGQMRDSDVLVWGGLRGRQGRWSRVPAVGEGDRGGPPAQRRRRSGTQAPTGLRQASAAQRVRVRLTRLPRGPPGAVARAYRCRLSTTGGGDLAQIPSVSGAIATAEKAT